jgi:hypothetical protein
VPAQCRCLSGKHPAVNRRHTKALTAQLQARHMQLPQLNFAIRHSNGFENSVAI